MAVSAAWTTRVTLPHSPYPETAVEARLRFDSTEPYAVCLVFPPLRAEDEPVEWWFARELLNEGRHAPVGQGDVIVAPGPDATVHVTLRSRTGQAVISIPGDAVTGFLLDSFALIPAGSESEHLDLDAELARLCA
ncbi:SsgA family sporulation/cell division regulator [Kitasatospora cheerisanensis]|uniref:Putative sporulation and cell division protein n=1 Tax=Kitasatospora cheerisanensis KCTC 2395 TaxID=1348663 RepID=A0A066Z1L3_9ACTN|nr:SsgA family sporulation/cell division regulator [Kitasatospora cheerisanensis]KDN87658.1 putative sporulation and cell division protein [Kitasatospora cheerisanensis KCTC 2395]